MNYRYLILDIIFLLPALVLLARTAPTIRARILLILPPLLLLTLVFDNLLIGAGIVAYHEPYLLGIKLGLAPIEDFAYTIAAAIYLPLLWERFTRENS